MCPCGWCYMFFLGGCPARGAPESFRPLLYSTVVVLLWHRNKRRTITPLCMFKLTSKSVIFSGIQPTGIPHLGNYLGALRQWVRLQDEAPPHTKLLYSIVDLHALTSLPRPSSLRRWRKETLAALLAVGLDPKRCIIFFQSDVCVAIRTFKRHSH